MLIVRKNQLNNLIATVSMNRTLQSPYYLFSFQHIVSKERISFIPEVVTTNTRYDKFRFIEGNPTNLSVTPPIAQFLYDGQYYYSIYEQLSPTNTNIALTYNKLESGRAVVIVGDDQTDECFFEPYISSNEDDANIIYLSEQEEICQEPVTPTPTNTTTPSVTPTNTATPTTTPTMTPTPSTTPSLPSGVLQFLVHRGGSQNSACSGNPNQYVYAQDLGLCGPCLPLTCWPCLSTSQQVFSDVNLTTIVPNGYYNNEIQPGNFAVWHIVGGLPQGGSYMSC